jgi:alkyl sulfatase BDS1-like metallo-beta-lactamase superfamily hydrolase
MEAEMVTAILRARLGRCQAAGEKLAVENFSLTDELAKQKLTLQDVNEFLTNELKSRSLATAQVGLSVAAATSLHTSHQHPVCPQQAVVWRWAHAEHVNRVRGWLHHVQQLLRHTHMPQPLVCCRPRSAPSS